MTLNGCNFQTNRMDVGDWSHLLTGECGRTVRDTFLISLLSQAVTRDLPAGWQGFYDQDRALSWFADRLDEGAALLIADRSEGRPVGLLILAESEITAVSRDIFLGYLIHESDWGKGLATEVVAGFVDWCHTDGTVRSIVAGVTDRNAASARVLRKNGFVPVPVDDPTGGVRYTLLLAE